MEEKSEIKHFLCEEVFSHFDKLKCPELKHTYLGAQNVDINSKLYRLVNLSMPLFQKFINFRLKRNSSKDISMLYYVDPSAYVQIIRTLSERVNLFIINPFRCSPFTLNRKRNIFFSFVVLIARRLNYGITKSNDEQIFRSLDELRRLLLRNTPDIIVLNDSIYPINRALILAAREIKIPTVEIQHAIYPLSLPLIESRADYVFVWGESFKQMYLNQGAKSDSVKILGFPHHLEEMPTDADKRSLTVCYLAQGFHNQDINNLNILLENAISLKQICEENGMDFRCRLHPNSPPVLLEKILPRVECVPKDERLIDTIKTGDIFISFSSTSLVEAALHGKHCIQLRNIPVLTEDFEQLGICPKSFTNIGDVESYLKTLVNVRPNELKQFHKKVDPEYIDIPLPNPGVRFVELIHEVIGDYAR
jgi:hypothetical protein